jgi:hypothetical protein
MYQATQRIHVRRSGQELIKDILGSCGGKVSVMRFRPTGRGVLIHTNVIKRSLGVRRHPVVIRRKLPLGRGAIWLFEGNGEAQATQFPVALWVI